MATLYDLKLRKFLAIDQSDPANPQAELIRYDQQALTKYEDVLMRFLFHEEHKVVIKSALGSSDAMYLQAYFNFLYLQSLQAKGYITPLPGYEGIDDYVTFLNKARANMLPMLKQYIEGGITNSFTDKARAIMPALAGFRLYITTAELDRIKFQMKDTFEDYLEKMAPYAVAFDQIERWQLIKLPIFALTDGDGNDYKLRFVPVWSEEYKELEQKRANNFDEEAIIRRIDSYVIATPATQV